MRGILLTGWTTNFSAAKQAYSKLVTVTDVTLVLL